MDSQEQQLIDRIKQAQNVLVTVSTNPSVDQLAAAIGLTIALNKLNKHGTAVFSGQIPSTIEFLKPEDTLEKNTDSLRDFIIALDKSKADKLRYKVEDQVVRIFITPYRTSLSEKDLQFSQGDFNVDIVVALGVADQKDVDVAITAHGRILHDATVASVSVASHGDLGTINWSDEHASSLSEMMLGLIDGLDKSLLDGQIATALLTGVVATTDRFRNEHTTPKAMNASAELMAAGANQQLIASELDTAPSQPVAPAAQSQAQHDSSQDVVATDNGTLDIDHEALEQSAKPSPEEYRAPAPEADLIAEASREPEPQIRVDYNGQLSPAASLPSADAQPPLAPPVSLYTPSPSSMPPLPTPPPIPSISQVHVVEPDETAADHEAHGDRITTPPTMGGVLNPAATDDDDAPLSEALTLPAPMLDHNESVLPPTALLPRPGEADKFIPQAPLPPAFGPAPSSPLTAMPDPFASPLAPPGQPYTPPAQPLPSAVRPVAPVPLLPPVSPASAGLRPGETLEDLEAAVHSPHLGQRTLAVPAAGTPLGTTVDTARDAVQAALNAPSPADEPPRSPIAALNALPLGPDLHSMPAPPSLAASAVTQPGPGSPTPDPVLDLPSPSNPFGPGQQATPVMPQQGPAAPSVPPPFVPPQPH